MAEAIVGGRRRIGETLHGTALNISADTDLTDTGQAKKLAKQAAAEVGKFSSRLRQGAISAKVADGAKLSEAQAMEWRSALRGLPREQLIETLRSAAAGQIAGAEQIMATIATCNSPLLLGLGPQDGGVVETILGDYRQSVAGQEVARLADLDQIVADAARAEDWLFSYAAELVGGEHQLRAAEAEARGARPLSSLTTAEKAARVAAGLERGDEDLRESLFTAAPDEAPAGKTAGVARFSRLSLAEKVERVERGAAAGLSPAEIMRASVSAEE